MHGHTIALLFSCLIFSSFSVAFGSVSTQNSEDSSCSDLSIDLLAPTANQRCDPVLLENLQASARHTLQVTRLAESSQEEARRSEVTQRWSDLEETQIEGTQMEDVFFISTTLNRAPIQVQEIQSSGTDLSDFAFAQYTPEDYAQREDFYISSPVQLNSISHLLGLNVVKCEKLFVFDADFVYDPILADRAFDYLIPKSKMPRSGIVGKVVGREDCYFAFPFKTESILDYLVSSHDSHIESDTHLNRLFKTPDKKRHESGTCPNAPLRKRARYQLEPTPDSVFRAELKEWPASEKSALDSYLTDLNELMNSLGLPEMNREYLIAFEQQFDNIFMKALKQFEIEMILPALLLSMLPESDFSKFHKIRKTIDFESLQSSEFAQKFLLAVMKLPATSDEALDFLSSSINAPFLFNHECSGQSNLYAGKFCFEQVVAATKHVDTEPSEANLLGKWLVNEIKKPFELNAQTAIMSIVYLEFMSVCFATRESFLRFLLTLFKMYADSEYIREAVGLRFNNHIKDGNLSRHLLQFALETEDLKAIVRLYSIFTLESAEPALSNHIRTVNVRDDHPSYYTLEIENVSDIYSHSITDRKVIILPKI
jgi:hypothetical protein